MFPELHTAAHAHSREAHRPILHDGDTLAPPVGSLRARLDHLVEALEAEAPVASGRAEVPEIKCSMCHEVVLRPLQAGVLGDGVENVQRLQPGDGLLLYFRGDDDWLRRWQYLSLHHARSDSHRGCKDMAKQKHLVQKAPRPLAQPYPHVVHCKFNRCAHTSASAYFCFLSRVPWLPCLRKSTSRKP